MIDQLPGVCKSGPNEEPPPMPEWERRLTGKSTTARQIEIMDEIKRRAYSLMNQITVMLVKAVDPTSPMAGFGSNVAFDAKRMAHVPQVGDLISHQGQRYFVAGLVWDLDAENAVVFLHVKEVGDNSGESEDNLGDK